MTRIFLNQNQNYTDPVIFSVSDGYSMETTVQLMNQLEQEGGYEFENDHWKREGYGNLVEAGIKIYFEGAVFRIMCSYSDIFIYRVSGSTQKFYDFCEKVRCMEFE